MAVTDWNRLTAEALRLLAARDAVVLLPVASVEQHGPHLPTGVDDILVTAVCRRAARLLTPGMPVVVAPTVWCGLADHHVAFGGTFSLSLATYHALLRDLCRSILKAGFGKIVLVNGHAGNIAGLAAISADLTRELEAPIATATYFMLAAAEIAGLLEDQGGLMHACEAETSMMMATGARTGGRIAAPGRAWPGLRRCRLPQADAEAMGRVRPADGVRRPWRYPARERCEGRGLAGRLRHRSCQALAGWRTVEPVTAPAESSPTLRDTIGLGRHEGGWW